MLAAEPRLAPRIFADGKLIVGVFVNDRDARTLGGPDAPLADGDVVRLLPPVAAADGRPAHPGKEPAVGDLLRIDLTTRTVTTEVIPAELVRDYIGGKGIGTHLLLDGGRPRVDPLGPPTS